MNAIDTNVFVYSLDGGERTKQRQALSLLEQLANSQTVLLWQVACEYLGQLQKRCNNKLMTVEEMTSAFGFFLGLFPLVTPSSESLTVSLDLRSRYSLSHWDSLLIAGCLEAGVTTLFSEDMQAGANYDGVQIVNPFAQT
ncbi:MAG: PIN domain-containing protein [Fimbriiglobus sp.]